MPGTPEERHSTPHQPAPPLPGPVEDVDRPMTIIGGPAVEDTARWQPTPAYEPATPPPGQPAAYQGGGQVPGQSSATTSITGFFSSVRRNGRWNVPPVLTLVQGLSEVRLDFREAIVTNPVVELRIYGAFTDCKAIVPPGVDVEWGGGAALFSDEKSDPPKGQDPSMWRLRVVHYGAFSDIKIKTLGLGETEPKWWKKFM